ncbi:unnamed protein product [Durusdinium trenchii]
MLHYGGKTPKRHYAFSNSRHVAKLNAGKLTGWAKRKRALESLGQGTKLVDKYVDSQGKARWKGNKELRGSENYPAKFGCKLVELFDLMKAEKSGLPELPSDLPSTEEIFESMTFEDNWSESWVVEVCHYLRGGKHLRIPPSFVKLLPKRL